MCRFRFLSPLLVYSVRLLHPISEQKKSRPASRREREVKKYTAPNQCSSVIINTRALRSTLSCVTSSSFLGNLHTIRPSKSTNPTQLLHGFCRFDQPLYHKHSFRVHKPVRPSLVHSLVNSLSIPTLLWTSSVPSMTNWGSLTMLTFA